VVRCGVDPAVYTPPAERFGARSPTVILFGGRLLHGKGLALLFEALAELRRRRLDVTARIVGDGPARGEAEHDVRRLGLPEPVCFLGALGQGRPP
jgi:glycogen(starch) synthase